MDAQEIKRKLCEDIDSVVRYLLPAAVKKGSNYLVGNIEGNKGDSMSIRTSGDIGKWTDFHTGQTGDIIDLWQAVQKKNSFVEALEDIKKYYNITSTYQFVAKKEKEYTRPTIKLAPNPPDKVMKWLTGREKGERHISKEVVERYKVTGEGNCVVFPFYNTKGELVNFKKRNIYDKKDMIQGTNPEPILFGWQAIRPEDRIVVIAEGECITGDAEILTPNGWVQLQNYNNELVAQYNENKKMEFVKPSAYIKKHYQGNLIRHEVKGWVSITTPEHNLVSIDKKGRTRKHPANNPYSSADLIPRIGILDGAGIPLTDDQIKLIIAISADATIDIRKQTGNRVGAESRYVRFGLKKERKIQRLREILNNLGLKYGDNPIANGYQSICLPIPDWVTGKLFDWNWIGTLNIEQRKLILSELPLWDGNFVNNRDQYEYSSKHKYNADWVQALAHTTGRCSTIMKRKNQYGEWYKVSILNKKTTSSWQAVKTTEVPHNDYVYCVTVPSGMMMVRQEDKITITGNCDALSYAHYGYPALSVPMGGGKKQSHWIEREYENLLRFEKIYISMDMDEAGQIAMAEIVDRLGRHRCAIIDLDAKDANEILCTGVIEKSYFDNYVEAARYLDPDELRNAAEYREDVWKHVQNPDMLGSKLPFVDTHPDVGIRKAELSIWSGFNGSGKTTVLSLVANDLMAQGEKFCIASMEIKPVVLLAKMSKQVANRGYEMIDKPHHDRIFEWFNDKLWLFDVVGTTKSDTILEVFAYARKRYGVTQFIIDSLMKCGIASDDYKGQKAFVDKLCDFKNEHNVHIHLVAHSRKLESEDKEVGKMDIKGTGDITDLSDNIFITWRNKKKEDEKRKPEHLRDEKIIKQPDAILSCVKQRNGNGDEGKYGLTFDKYSNRYYGKDDIFLLESPYVR